MLHIPKTVPYEGTVEVQIRSVSALAVIPAFDFQQQRVGFHFATFRRDTMANNCPCQ